MRAWVGGAIIGIGLGLLWPTVILAAEPPALFFRELMWAGTDRSTADEWFVLTNSTDSPLVLDGWRVTILSGGTEKSLTSLDGQVVAPRGSLLIASHDQHHQFTGGESALALDPDLIVSSLSLSNSALQLKLYGSSGSSPIDVAGNGKAPLKGSVGSATKVPPVPWTAMTRIEPALDGTLASSWTAAGAAGVRRLDPPTDPTRVTHAAPDHAGRPSVTTLNLPPIPAGIPTLVSLLVSDPDGDDDIASVTLSCPDQTARLVDTGLSGDPAAGDRSYGGRLTVPVSGTAACTATVADRSGLSRIQNLSLLAYVRTANVVVNELLPNPSTGEEFIELWNLEAHPIDLTGWQIDDVLAGGSKPFSLSDTIAANGYVVIPASRSKLALNNDGDDVHLLNPEGTVIDATHYPAATSGRAWVRFQESWQWVSRPTPGALNQADPAPEPAPQVSVPTPTVAAFVALPSQTVAQLTGRVVALPGTLSSRSWLLDDGTGVAEIYLDRGTFSPLTLGDWVSVTGRRSGTAAARLLLNAGTTDPLAQPARVIQPRSLAETLTLSAPATTVVTGQLTLTKINTKTLTTSINGRSVRLAWSELTPEKIFSKSLVIDQSVTVTGILVDADRPVPSLILRVDEDLIPGAPPPITPAVAAPVATNATALPVVSPPAGSRAVSVIRSAGRTVRDVAAEAATRVGAAARLARLMTEVKWLNITIQAHVLNRQLTTLIERRQLGRMEQWQQFDRSAMVALLVVLGSIQLAAGWHRFSLSSSPIPWPGG